MSDRLKKIMSDIVNHCDSGADYDYEIKITNGDLIRWYDGLEVVQAQMRDAAIQVERKRPAPQASQDLFRRAADALRDIDPFGDKFSQRDLELIEHGHPVREFACEHCGGSGFSGSSQPTSNINECPSCHRMFKDGETCSRGGCPMGGDF